MSLITASSISKSYGAVDIFEGISLSIPPAARIGLVGPNGVGKTTLLRVLLREEQPTKGKVHWAKNVRVGYLPQETLFRSNHNLWEECLQAMGEVQHLQEQLHEIERQMQNQPESAGLLEQYGTLQEKFEKLGGYTYEVQIRKVLDGLGFSRTDEQRPINQFSGGERTRAYLARLLLSAPELLLLDEPSNHLDMQAVEWLEGFLKSYSGALLAVSHDRYFLDQVVDTIWEMTPELETFRGNYSAYVQQREERYQRLAKEYSAQKTFIEKEEEYIRRNIAGQNTRQAQGRRKRLERLLKESRITLPDKQRAMRLHLADVKRSGDKVLTSEDLVVGYTDDGIPLFRTTDLCLLRGECVAILGPNGAGKTTFLKTILGELPPLQGEVHIGASVQIGYFAQAHENLHPDWTLMQEMQAIDAGMLPKEVHDRLGAYQFSGDDIQRKVAELSGGERGRLALACLALQRANLLFLDEPTNHLDLVSQEILQSALAQFDGTILLVTHDRYLVDALATQIWEVNPRAKELIVFQGSYSEYKEFLRKKETQASTPEKASKSKNAKARKETKINPQQQKLLEEEIRHIEQKIKDVENAIKDTSDPTRVGELGEEYLALQTHLDSILKKWDNLFHKGHDK